MKKQFRIVFTVVASQHASEEAARRALRFQSDDLDEYCSAAIECNNVTAKIQERINIALPDENGGHPLWVWKDLPCD
jgi:hypothetical protein